MNRVCISGTLAAKPTLRYTPSNKAVAEFTIMVSSGREQPFYFRFIAWEDQAHYINDAVKGAVIAVDGKLQSRKYKDSNDNERTITEIVATSIENHSMY